MSNKKYSEKFLKCIDLERKADIDETSLLLNSLSPKKLAIKGLAVLNLVTDNMKTGLAGRTILELKNDPGTNKSDEILSGDIRTGDIVKVDRITPSGSSKKSTKSKHKTKSEYKDDNDDGDTGCEAVVTRVSINSMVLTINENDEDRILNIVNERLWIVKISNSVTYKRMESTMRKLAEIETPDPLIQLLLLDSKYIRPSDSQLASSYSQLKFYNDALNQSQKDAINFSLNSPISIIHGPPGTGKTYTLIEIIRQLVNKGQRVLVCGPSNISVDTILERLDHVMSGDKLLRIGHPARLLPANLKHCLDIVSVTSDGGQLVADIKKEIDATIKKIKKTKSYREKKQIWQDVKELRKELRVRERKVTNELILQASVVVTTLHGSSSRDLTSFYNSHSGLELFDTIIIDEVSQALEPQCWIPIINHQQSHIEKLILAGDNKQLPPTIKIENNDEIKSTLSTTLFDRLVHHYGDSFKMLLNIQYRMNKTIMEFPSKALYNNQLRADKSVESIKLYDLDNVEKTNLTDVPIVWYDTQGDEFPEQDNSESRKDIIPSKFNEMEALIVLYHVEELINSNVDETHIGIIAPYNAQVSYLKSLIHPKYPQIEISTVDGFQGREKEVIIFSLVRSNLKREVGFLADERRLNVAITRPKRQLCLVGDMETITRGSKFLKEWVEWNEENSDIVYIDPNDIL